MGWKQASEAEEFKFEKEGDEIVGKLTNVNDTQYDSKVYTIIDSKDDMYYFFGCYQLDSVLPKLVGHYVNITYKGKTAIQGDREVRNYDIAAWVDKEGKRPDGFDEEIPF